MNITTYLIISIILLQGYTTIIDNQVAYHPFEEEITREGLANYFETEFILNYKLRQSKHSPGQDTLFKYTFGDSYFSFIKAPSGRTFFDKCKIRDERFKMRGMYIGMSKEEFASQLGVELIQGSIVMVVDNENLVAHVFRFSNDKLDSAEINMYVD